MIDIVLGDNEKDVGIMKVDLLNPLVNDAEIVHLMYFSESDRSSAKNLLSHLRKQRRQVDNAGTRVGLHQNCFVVQDIDLVDRTIEDVYDNESNSALTSLQIHSPNGDVSRV